MTTSTVSLAPIREVYEARDLLKNLAARELKVRYRRSVVGFAWTLLNPLLLMTIFSVIFGAAFRGADIRHFPLFFLVAYLPWSFFQASCQVSTGVVVANRGLVTKVYFPRSVLPLSIVASQLVHVLAALSLLFLGLTVMGYGFWPYLPFVLLGLVTLVVFTAGVSLLLAATNTVFRDVKELTGLAFLAWFYLTPVVYPESIVPASASWVIELNPMTHFVRIFRTSLYELATPPMTSIIIACASAIVSLAIGAVVFGALSDRFAKEV